MRLIHAADYGGPYPGSFIPMLRAVLGLGRERGMDVAAVFSEVARDRPWVAELEADGIPVHFMAVSSRRDVRAGLEALLGDGGPCVLHTHFSSFDLPAAALGRSRPDTTVLWHMLSPLLPGPRAWARNAVRFALLSRGVERILCVAPDLAEDVKGRLAPRSRVEFVPNPIDTERFRPPTGDERARARRALGLPPDAPVLAHCGWDWTRKGGDVYLSAVARLARERLVAVTVGGGRKAEAAVSDLGLGSTVRVLEPVQRVEDVYAAADVFVSPSRAEGMPWSIIESLATGTAVVASDIPGQRWIGDRVDACRIVPLEAGSIAAGVESLLDRPPEQAAAEAEAARARIVETMDVRVWAERMHERYPH
jgi:glycosyltransferase involved in cell wall biosynthesis